MFFKSIRWRLQIWYCLILLGVLGGFGFTAYRLESGRQFRRIDDDLHRRVNGLLNAIDLPFRGPGPDDPGFGGPDQPGEPPETERPPPGRRNRRLPWGGGDRISERLEDFALPPRLSALFDEGNMNGYYYVIWTVDGKELTHSTNTPTGGVLFPQFKPGNEDGPPGQRAPAPYRGEGPRPPQPARMRGVYREVSMFARGEVVLVGRSVAPELAELRQTAWTFVAAGGVILLFGLAGGWWLACRAIRPIEEISAAAVKISAGDLSRRINVAETESELGRLASVLNSTFTRLEKAFVQQQQFTADAAHELRTPVSVMLTQTQTSLNRERGAPEYRATIEACQRSAQRMRRLIESLLQLARIDAGEETMNRSPFDLARTVADCLELVRPLAANRNIAIRTAFNSAECLGDSERLGQVITNLLTNAVHHNNEGGELRIATHREGHFAVVEVADDGPGIAPEHLPHVFDRFYRVDSARTTSQGRSGLGLAISKAIIDAQGGIIEVVSEEGKGTTFTVRVPAAA
jgi:heavy metal sensor kinase